MNETRIIAAILTAGVLSTSTKSATASRAITIFNDLLDSLTPANAAPAIEQPPPPRRAEARVRWFNGDPA